MLAFDGPARRWESKRQRLRIFAAGRTVPGGRRRRLRGPAPALGRIRPGAAREAGMAFILRFPY